MPHCADDTSIGNKLINARCETVHEKATFRQAIKSRRCIVPASGYYEWSTTPAGKIPHYISLADGSPLSMAGIWETWKSPEGQAVETFAILTTAANSLVTPLHNRMPVILHRTEFDYWLDRSVNDPHELQRLYQPYPAELMQEWEVTPKVNSAAYESEDCVRPL